MDSIRKPYLRHVLDCIAEHPSHRIEELLSWNVAAELRSDTRATRRLNRQPRQDGLYRTLTLKLPDAELKNYNSYEQQLLLLIA